MCPDWATQGVINYFEIFSRRVAASSNKPSESYKPISPRKPINRHMTSFETLKAVTLKLLDYCQANGFTGYDPYDALNSRLFQALPLLDHRLPRLVLTQLLKQSPVNFRRTAHPQKREPEGRSPFSHVFFEAERPRFAPNRRPDSADEPKTNRPQVPSAFGIFRWELHRSTRGVPQPKQCGQPNQLNKANKPVFLLGLAASPGKPAPFLSAGGPQPGLYDFCGQCPVIGLRKIR